MIYYILYTIYCILYIIIYPIDSSINPLISLKEIAIQSHKTTTKSHELASRGRGGSLWARLKLLFRSPCTGGYTKGYLERYLTSQKMVDFMRQWDFQVNAWVCRGRPWVSSQNGGLSWLKTARSAQLGPTGLWPPYWTSWGICAWKVRLHHRLGDF